MLLIKFYLNHPFVNRELYANRLVKPAKNPTCRSLLNLDIVLFNSLIDNERDKVSNLEPETTTHRLSSSSI